MDETVDQMVRRAQAGDREAFADLIHRFEGAALAVAFAVLSDGDLAGEAVQDAFLRAWQRLAELREPERFAAWLCGIVRNLARDLRRRNRRECRVNAALSLALRSDCWQAPESRMEQQEMAQRVLAALAELDELSRAAVVLRYYEGYSSKQIGELLELGPAAVDMRLSRARQLLKRLLGEY